MSVRRVGVITVLYSLSHIRLKRVFAQASASNKIIVSASQRIVTLNVNPGDLLATGFVPIVASALLVDLTPGSAKGRAAQWLIASASAKHG